MRRAYARLHGEQARAAAIQTLESQKDQIELLRSRSSLPARANRNGRSSSPSCRPSSSSRAEGIDLASTEGQAILANAGFIERLSQELARSQGAMQALQSMIDSTFNRFADLVSQGKTDWKSWADAGKAAIADIEKELLKLAVLNPLKNFLFGTNLTTLDNVGGLLGSLFGFKLHAGGIAGVDGSPRAIPAAVFRGAPRLHARRVPVPRRGARHPAARGARALARGTSRYDRTERSSPIVLNFAVQTPDAASFRRAQSQITADLASALRRAERNL